MEIVFKGKKAIVQKENFYCKAGAYEHKMRVGWAVMIDGEVVLGFRNQSNGWGAERYEYPQYKTRKSLLEDVERHNIFFEKRKEK
jgi:hypothetical protein